MAICSPRMVFSIKLIVTDLDNTLLRRDKSISGYTVDVFRRVRERGILVAFATARDFRFVIDHIMPTFNIMSDIVIADNGALARFGGKSLYKKLIPAEIANALLPRFDLARCLSTENAYYLSTEQMDDHWSIGKKDTVISDLSGGVKDDVLYLDGYTSKAPLVLTESFPDVRAVAYSDVSLTTIVHREATKYNALIATQRALGIPTEEIAVFGDDYSDVEILSYCGLSIAMSNAIDEAKAVADLVCGDCDEDGVANWIAQNIL